MSCIIVTNFVKYTKHDSFFFTYSDGVSVLCIVKSLSGFFFPNDGEDQWYKIIDELDQVEPIERHISKYYLLKKKTIFVTLL